MRMLLSSLLAAQLAFAAGCGGEVAPVSPEDADAGPQEAPSVQPSIRDGAHDGPEGFYFLPPMVDEPTVDGTFDASRSPTVEVCLLLEASCEPVIATFTMDTGPGSETVRVDTTAEHYVANLHTPDFKLLDGQIYRVRVLLEGREAGHADILVVNSGKELKNADTSELIPLKDGRTLPIKFRVEEELVLEFTVPAVTPDTLPEGVYDRRTSDSPVISGTFLTNIVLVVFEKAASQSARQAAVDTVNGEVIGGLRHFGDEGYYFVRIQDDHPDIPGNALVEAMELLSSLPQVRSATLEFIFTDLEGYRRPDDGSGWGQTDWRLRSDSADGDNWSLERIDAPLAWGCGVGDDSVRVAVVDRGFHSVSDIDQNRSASLGFGVHVDTLDHGTSVSAVLAARGDNGEAITGTMWRAGLQLYDAGVDTTGRITRDSLGQPELRSTEVAERIERAGRAGARVINLSLSIKADVFKNPGSSAPSADSNLVKTVTGQVDHRLEVLADDGIRPLLVIGAGNGDKNDNGINAFWSGFAPVRDSLPNQVLVVAASEQMNASGDRLAPFSNRNNDTLDLVEIAAPGVNISTLGSGGNDVALSGTSFAAPYVAGVAGLLASFDPRLSAADLKQFIVDGADRGGRDAGGIPLLNAREALKAAAERDGAPLCGNRVWTADGNIVARRTANVVETLVSGVPEPTGQVEVLHGGKHLLFVTPGQGFFAQWSSEGWGPGQSLPTNFDELRGGTRRSVFGESHDRDSIADIDVEPILGDWYFSEASRQAPVEINVVEDGTTISAGSIVVDNIEDALQETCIERDPVDTSTCYVTLTEQRQWLLRLGYPQLPSSLLEGAPDASNSVVAVNPLRSVVVDFDDWQPCGVNTDHECRRVDIRQFHVEAQISTLDLRAGAGETPEPLATIPDESVFWIGQSENNDELVLARGQWLVTWEGHADSLRTTGTPFFNGQTSTQECRIEYRERLNFSQVNDVIPTLDACEGGTVGDPSPGAGGGTIAPIIAPVESEGAGTEKSLMLPLVTSLESG